MERLTPFAKTVQDSPVLSQQSSLHDLELQRSILCSIVDAINRELICAERTGVVPRIIAGDGSLVSTTAIHLADAVEVRVAVACEAVVDPLRSWKAVVVLHVELANAHGASSSVTDLEIIHSPLRKSRCINLLVAQRAGVAPASHGASARVHAILETQGVDQICGTAHPIREFGGVWLQSACDGVAATHLGPAVIEDDVFVPGVFEA
jgi:hypothetical protein